MTRNRAAEVLGVNPQTISNYIRDGILGGYKDEKGFVYVNGDDVERYAKKYRLIAVSEEMLDRKLKEIRQLKEQANAELAELREAAISRRCFRGCSSVRELVSALYCSGLIRRMTAREHEILTAFLNGSSPQEIAGQYGLTVGRIQQLLAKGCHRVSRFTKEIQTEIRYRWEVTDRNRQLLRALQSLPNGFGTYRDKQGEKHRDPTLPPDVLQQDLFESRLKRSVAQWLKREGVETVGDLVTRYTSADDLRTIRNFGRKSASIVEDFVEGLGLSFKRKGESYEDFYRRLNQ